MEPWLMFFYTLVLTVILHGFFRGWYAGDYKGIKDNSQGLIDRL
jgi:hypothetical protein